MSSEVDISFLIPTNRPWGFWGANVVNCIQNAYGSKKYKYEILVCSQQIDPKRSGVTWIEEGPISLGPSPPLTLMANKAKGKLLVGLVDDQFPPPYIFDIVERMKFFPKNRQFKIASLPAEAGKSTSHLEVNPVYSDVLRKMDCYMDLSGLHIMHFPIIERDTFINKLNGFFGHPYCKSMLDVYLGFFLWANGEPGIIFSDFGMNKDPKSDTHIWYEQTYDRITKMNVQTEKFGETVVNLYRLARAYKPGMPYVDFPGQPPYITEEEILEELNKKPKHTFIPLI